MCLLTALGSTICYGLSWLFGRELVNHFLPTRIHALRRKVHANRQDLFFYLLFMRMFPLTPNWFLNMVRVVCGWRCGGLDLAV